MGFSAFQCMHKYVTVQNTVCKNVRKVDGEADESPPTVQRCPSEERLFSRTPDFPH